MKTKLLIGLPILAIAILLLVIPRGQDLDKLKTDLDRLEEQKQQLLGDWENESQLLEHQYLQEKNRINELYQPQINGINKEIEDIKQKALSAFEIETKRPTPLMTKICEDGQIHGNTSPLCDNDKLYHELEDISKQKGVPFELMVGITMSESHIGANFKPAHCEESNNRAGIKGMKLDDGSVDYGKFPTENGCWVYNFQSVPQFRYSFANSLKLGYIDKDCSTAECISKYRVGGDGDKSRWIDTVNSFKKVSLAKQ